MSGTPGYLRLIKTTVVEAVQQSFMAVYPETDPQGGAQPVHCSVDYPVEAQMVPAIWVDYETTLLTIAGINQTETDASGGRVTHWRYEGFVTFTVVAMTSNECDLIYDELVSLIAFAAQSEDPGELRARIDANPLIATTWSFDTIEGRAQGPSIGTPWGTDDIIYERGMAIQSVGEFFSSPSSLTLLPLSEIIITATDEAPDGGSFEIDVPNQPGERFGI